MVTGHFPKRSKLTDKDRINIRRLLRERGKTKENVRILAFVYHVSEQTILKTWRYA